ncbi:MAG: hypothetical protein FJX46_12370 [Alphaproteobacteria bacterium]|nr:hypothetical protein [Alphaproteobacteria bacterium]
MTFQILQGAPLWVWPLLALLVALGLMQARSRQVTRTRVLVLPLAMVGLSLYGVWAALGISPSSVGAWLLGVAAAYFANERIFRAPNGVTYDPATARFAIPGSWVPLVLMLAIFAARFAVGVTAALSPATVKAPGFVFALGLGLGFCSGLFLARAGRTLRSLRDTSVMQQR